MFPFLLSRLRFQSWLSPLLHFHLHLHLFRLPLNLLLLLLYLPIHTYPIHSKSPPLQSKNYTNSSITSILASIPLPCTASHRSRTSVLSSSNACTRALQVASVWRGG